ncbi:putative nuclease HARBI1 [Pogonomyrmex barbatus]|uniref:Nuclease HARBI1 n=1 Tax=Pogonomyrmex barbatus TaxID=144034 RepID=A0A6I9XE70_9HYME|nr:putative nuclease HARBI1 [Pogonomyrmex barbatus]XP_011643401.1 putative nuclease HARBI1 [Pogonomyrmex barbatus]
MLIAPCRYLAFRKKQKYLYINRKLYHSLNVLIVSDYYGKILALNSGNGERTYDARVRNASTISAYFCIKQQYNNRQRNCWLFGQSEHSPSAHYTNAHVRTRSSVERTIGVLKRRWGYLRKERRLHYSSQFSALIANAYFIMWPNSIMYLVTSRQSAQR